MIRQMRDFAIFIFVMYALTVAVWARMYPNAVGYWEAQKDIAYDQIWAKLHDCNNIEFIQHSS